MTSELEIEVFRALREAQNRYAYFLLAATGGAIALVVNQTQDVVLSTSQIPLLFAVLLWGASFFCGCRHLAYVSSALYANAELLETRSGEHQLAGSDPRLIEVVAAKFLEVAEENANRGNRYAQWQFRLLVAGAIASAYDVGYFWSPNQRINLTRHIARVQWQGSSAQVTRKPFYPTEDSRRSRGRANGWPHRVLLSRQLVAH